jgi:hypothetical protein
MMASWVAKPVKLAEGQELVNSLRQMLVAAGGSLPAESPTWESPMETAKLSRGDFLPDIHVRQGSNEDGSPVFESPTGAGDAPGSRGDEGTPTSRALEFEPDQSPVAALKKSGGYQKMQARRQERAVLETLRFPNLLRLLEERDADRDDIDKVRRQAHLPHASEAAIELLQRVADAAEAGIYEGGGVIKPHPVLIHLENRNRGRE